MPGNHTGVKIQDNPELLTKLEEAYSMGCTDAEACLFAGVSTATLFGYINRFPEFSERKEKLKQFPVLKARKKVVTEISKDTGTAKWYLERKTKEFKPPDRQGGNTNNTLILLTETQLKDRLAHKLSNLLTNIIDQVEDSTLSTDSVSDAELVGDDIG